MSSMSSGIAFPMKFNFKQMANNKKLNNEATVSAVEEVEEVEEEPKTIPPSLSAPLRSSFFSVNFDTCFDNIAANLFWPAITPIIN